MSVARHSVYNLIGAAVPVAVSLVTVPLYLTAIGLDRYGVLAICWLLVGYFAAFDFGIGRALAQKIATLSAAPVAERNRIFWTGALISGALSIVALLLIAPLATLGLDLIKLQDESLRPEIRASVPFVVVAVPIAIAVNLFQGVLEGRRAFLRINIVASTGSVATAVLPLLTAYAFGPHLPLLLGAAVIGRLGVLLAYAISSVQLLPIQRPRFGTKGETRALLGFGGWTSISSIIGSLLVFLDRFAIGAVLGSAILAVYVVPFNLLSQLLVLPAALATALMPRLAEVAGERSATLANISVGMLAAVITPMTIGMLILSGPFLQLWIPATAAGSIPIAYLCLIGFWSNSLARVPFVHLQAHGRPDLAARLHLIEIIPYLAALYIGMRLFGLPGAALAWSLRATIDAAALFLIDRTLRPSLRLIAHQAPLIIAGTLIMFATPAEGALRWLLLALLVVLTIVTIVRDTPRDVRETLLRFARPPLGRKPRA